MKHNDNLIWIDLEMTGLSPEDDRIIEIATLITDKNLNVLADGPNLVISQSESRLKAMDAWNTKQHGESGLIDKVISYGIPESVAENKTLDFLINFIDSGRSPMCGNSICLDRRFLCKYMPTLEGYFHYRNLDVSTLKELALRLNPQILKDFSKSSKHLALSDIYDSISELKFYRDHFLLLP